jgi:hypothetical protein
MIFAMTILIVFFELVVIVDVTVIVCLLFGIILLNILGVNVTSR